MNQHMPLRKLSRKQTKFQKKPWLTSGLLKSIKNKNKMFSALCKVKFQNKALQQKYKRYRNILNRVQYKAKICYYRQSVHTWRLINEITNHKNTQPKLPNSVTYHNTSITNLDDICNILNNYYVNIVTTLANSILDYTNLISTFLCNRSSNLIFLKDTDPEEILQIISSLNPKKALGYDGISSKILQTLGYVISPILWNIFNESMQLGIFPDKLKIAKVIPLHKGGKTDVINNYQTISILSSLSKIYEKIKNNRLNNFLNKYNIIFDYHFGFCEGLSTTLALTDIRI